MTTPDPTTTPPARAEAVQRYEVGRGALSSMDQCEDGEYVRYEDYAALREALRLSQLRIGALTEIAHDVEVLAIRVRLVLEGVAE